jgi:uncharacterized protein YwgA
MERTDIILLLLFSNNSIIVGNTRLQKLLFLIEKEKGIIAQNADFGFEAYKFGPASKELYDDLEFLVNIGYIQRSNDEDRLPLLDINKIESYPANIFLSDKMYKDASICADSEELIKLSDSIESTETISPNELRIAEENDSNVYKLTADGKKYIEENDLNELKEFVDINEVANTFGKYSLTSLLQYVYRNYPEFTEESEIKGSII